MIRPIRKPLLFVFVHLVMDVYGIDERHAATNHSILNVDLVRSCNSNFLQLHFTFPDTLLIPGKYSITVDKYYCSPKHVPMPDYTENVLLEQDKRTNVIIPYNTSSDFKLSPNCSYYITFNDRRRRPLYGIQRHLPGFYFNQPVNIECYKENCICDVNEISIVQKDDYIELSDFGSYDMQNRSYLHNCNDEYVYQEVIPIIIDGALVTYFFENISNACLSLLFRKNCGCYIFKLIPVAGSNSSELRISVVNSNNNTNTSSNYTSTAKKVLFIFLGVLSLVTGLLYKSFKNLKLYMSGHGLSIEALEKCPRSSMRKPEIATLLKLDSNLSKVDSYELPRSSVELCNEIGKGAFGHVFLAKAIINGIKMHVAVKTLKDRATAEELDDFLAEIDVLKKVGEHGNIVRMYKCCTAILPYMMIMEYIPFGDLKNYLLDLRNEWNKERHPSVDSCFSDAYIIPDSPDSLSLPTETSDDTFDYPPELSPEELVTPDIYHVLDHRELQNFALQIAKGMTHLEKISITHRDLAARNILINERKVLKISDFGLSRAGPYITNNFKKVPLRWMAIEAIEDHFYDNKSDVWSFAVVLWEIGTLGGFPYEQIADNMLLYHIQNGKRLQRPAICTDELYELMIRCWLKEPNLRPTFEELVGLLDMKKRSIYIDFGQLNPSYVFPPAETILH